jgi:mannose-6-phosphate isomerase-like protein (cupin superfamily)
MILKSETIKPFDFEGLSIRDYTAALNTSSSLAYIRVLPNTRHRRAWSTECDKYYYVISGQLLFMLDGIEDTLKASDVCIIPQGHKFSYANVTETPVDLLLIHTPKFNMDAEVFEEVGDAS